MFKKGDILECVNNDAVHNYLTKGKLYTCTKDAAVKRHETFVEAVNDEGCKEEWFTSRFKRCLMFKKGDLLECVTNDEGYITGLTIGKTYTAVEDEYDECIGVCDNKRNVIRPYAHRFKLALKEGDKVRIVKLPECPGSRCNGCFVGSRGIWKIRENVGEQFVFDRNNRYCSMLKPEYLTKEDTMSKYDELKGRIEALDDGWNKEADDVLQEIQGEYYLLIGASNYIGISRTVLESSRVADFYYNSQCGKMTAFKQALIWLLDHSSIKKDEKKFKIREIEDKIDALKNEVKELKHV